MLWTIKKINLIQVLVMKLVTGINGIILAENLNKTQIKMKITSIITLLKKDSFMLKMKSLKIYPELQTANKKKKKKK